MIFSSEDYSTIGEIIAYIGLSTFIVDWLYRLVCKKRNISTILIIFIIFTVLNLIRHFPIFFYLSRLTDGYVKAFELYIIIHSIWLGPTIILIWITIKLIINNKVLEYNDYVRSNSFKIAVIVILLAIFFELPIWGFHPNFAGGIHAHGLWDAWVHIH